jgi:hypothetical protein
MEVSRDVGVWVAAFLTLGIYSFLYRDNPVYKFVEHIFVGTSAGYFISIAFWQAVYPLIWQPIFQYNEENSMGLAYWLVLVTTIPPTLLGLLMFSRFVPRISWLSRWPIALIIGIGAGTAIPAVVQARILEQLKGTMQPLFHSTGAPTHDALLAFNNLVLIVGVLCVLSYFYFSREHKGALGLTSRIGIWFLMIAFGAGFGNTVMARVSLLIGRLQFLLRDWLGLIN